MYAASYLHTESARLLIDAGADKDVMCKVCLGLFSEIAIDNCIFVGIVHFSCIRVSSRCFKPQNGFTALMWAAKKNHMECARMLLDVGADIDAQNKVRLMRQRGAE